MQKTKLSLVVPFYNEEKNIKKTLKILMAYLRERLKSDFELIFIDDGSTDKSLHIIKEQINKYPEDELISYSKNKGRGYALSLGFKKAKGSVIGYIDSDLEINQKYVIECLDKLRSFDIAVVSKHLPKSQIETSFLRKMASKLYNLWVSAILGSKISDHQGGLKLFKKDVLKVILSKAQSRRWLFDTELMYFAQLKGFKIGEVPINIRYGFGAIKSSMVLDFIKSFFLIVKLRMRNGKIS